MIRRIINKIRLWRLKRYLVKSITRDIWRARSVQTESEKIEALQKFYENVFIYQIYRKCVDHIEKERNK